MHMAKKNSKQHNLKFAPPYTPDRAKPASGLARPSDLAVKGRMTINQLVQVNWLDGTCSNDYNCFDLCM